MNTDLIRTFLEVAKTRHFGHAADNLFLTQSAVSFRVKQLEDVLGVSLFTRQRNNILLTSAGERLLPHAENLLANWQLAIQEVGLPKAQNLQLALGGTSNLWDVFLQSLLPKLAEKFPHISIRTEMNQSQHLIRSLLGGRLDIAVLLDAPSNMDIDSHLAGHLELIMVCNEPDKLLADIPSIGHVFVDWGTSVNLQQARLFEYPVAPVLHTGQSHIALEFILTHKGAAHLPVALVDSYVKEGYLYQVKDAMTIKQDVYLVYSRDYSGNEDLESIVGFIDSLAIKPDDPLR